MSVLSPTENIKLLFRIQVREDKVMARFIKLIKNIGFRIVDFDEALRRVVGYISFKDLDQFRKILLDYALSYSYELTVVVKTKNLSKILENIETMSKSSEIMLRKIYRNSNEIVYVFHKHKWWLINLLTRKGVFKVVLLKKDIPLHSVLSPYYYTFYDVDEIIKEKERILNDLKTLTTLFYK